MAPASSKEFLDIQASIECRFTLKLIRDMITTYTKLFFLQTFKNCDLVFLKSKRFPVSANPFKMSTAKAIVNTPPSTSIGCFYTLGRIISKTFILQ